MLLERKDEQTARCPFCHDGLAASRLVECSACRAVYHAECVERCVVLACQGTLAGADGDPAPTQRAVLRLELPSRAGEERAAPAPRSPRWVAVCRLGFLVSFGSFIGLLALAAFNGVSDFAFPAFVCFVACVAFAQTETNPTSPEARGPRGRAPAYRARSTTPSPPTPAQGLPPVEPAAPVTDTSPLPAPPPLAFPSMFGAPPAEGAAGGIDDEARRRISARREARRPGGLGKTL